MQNGQDNFALIYGIGELIGRFQDNHDIPEFLNSVTRTIAGHLQVDACSICLFEEETQELVLRASHGLNPAAVDKVRLRLGEGLAGMALQEMRVVVEARARDNPRFKAIPEIEEDQYPAFLGIPIVQGPSRLGLLVLQHANPGHFTEDDAKTLQTITTQLAMALENARLLAALHQGEPARTPSTSVNPEFARFLKGKTASEGIATGTAMLCRTLDDCTRDTQPSTGPAYSLEDFHRALRRTEEQILQLQQQLGERLTDMVSMIFSAHILILKDQQFGGEIEQGIQAGQPVPAAIQAVVEKHVQVFARNSSPRIREKAQDLRDLGRRLVSNLNAQPDARFDLEGRIVVVRELYPSGMLKLVAQRIAGIVLLDTGVTAHISILARSLEIPMVLLPEAAAVRIKDGMRLLMDANQGNLFLDPDDTILSHYQSLITAQSHLDSIGRTMSPTTCTRDGTRIHLLANINLLSDLKLARAFKAEGIGLYRSEFPFIIRNDFPSEEEQFQIYRRLLDEMQGQDVVFRTLDIGGDKMLSYYPHLDEANPFLGLRAIRFSLRNRQIFMQQLRALLRVGRDRPLKIMFPLVSSVDDLLLARDIVAQCCTELRQEGIPHNNHPLLGAMIELPSAVEVAEELAQVADFLSIGTNDLTQYMLAVDRTNKHISGWYIPHHPAVLRAIRRVVAAGLKYQKPVSICGDLAGELKLLPFLVGIGIRIFSLQPVSLPKVQQAIRQINLPDAVQQAEAILGMGQVREIAQFLGLATPWQE